MTGVRYRNMITEFLRPQLDSMDIEDTWFQQDSTTCHTARETTELLQEKFPGRVISRNGHQNWPPRSCDLTPCDFFLWGFVKSGVYANKPQTIPELEVEFRRVMAKLSRNYAEMSSRVSSKEQECASRVVGGHSSDIVFHN